METKNIIVKCPHPFLSLVNDQDTFDAKLNLKNIQIFAHKCILAGGSLVFKAMFFGGYMESKQGISEILINDFDENAFKLFVKYLYGSDIEVNDSNFGELLKIACYYESNSLLDQLTCLTNLFLSKKTILLFIDLYEIAPHKLRDFIQTHMEENINEYLCNGVLKRICGGLLKSAVISAFSNSKKTLKNISPEHLRHPDISISLKDKGIYVKRTATTDFNNEYASIMAWNTSQVGKTFWTIEFPRFGFPLSNRILVGVAQDNCQLNDPYKSPLAFLYYTETGCLYSGGKPKVCELGGLSVSENISICLDMDYKRVWFKKGASPWILGFDCLLPVRYHLLISIVTAGQKVIYQQVQPVDQWLAQTTITSIDNQSPISNQSLSISANSLLNENLNKSTNENINTDNEINNDKINKVNGTMNNISANINRNQNICVYSHDCNCNGNGNYFCRSNCNGNCKNNTYNKENERIINNDNNISILCRNVLENNEKTANIRDNIYEFNSINDSELQKEININNSTQNSSSIIYSCQNSISSNMLSIGSSHISNSFNLNKSCNYCINKQNINNGMVCYRCSSSCLNTLKQIGTILNEKDKLDCSLNKNPKNVGACVNSYTKQSTNSEANKNIETYKTSNKIIPFRFHVPLLESEESINKLLNEKNYIKSPTSATSSFKFKEIELKENNNINMSKKIFLDFNSNNIYLKESKKQLTKNICQSKYTGKCICTNRCIYTDTCKYEVSTEIDCEENKSDYQDECTLEYELESISSLNEESNNYERDINKENQYEFSNLLTNEYKKIIYLTPKISNNKVNELKFNQIIEKTENNILIQQNN